MANVHAARRPKCAIAGDQAVIVIDVSLLSGLTRTVLYMMDRSTILAYPYSEAAAKITQDLGGGDSGGQSVRTVSITISVLKQLGLLDHYEYRDRSYLVISDIGRLVAGAMKEARVRNE